MMAVRYAVRYEDEDQIDNYDIELGSDRTVAIEEIGRLACVVERRMNNGSDETWAHITLIVEET